MGNFEIFLINHNCVYTSRWWKSSREMATPSAATLLHKCMRNQSVRQHSLLLNFLYLFRALPLPFCELGI